MKSNRNQPPPRFRWPLEDSRDGRALAVEVYWNPRRRSRIGISFDAGGGLLVEAPPGTSAAAVQDVLRRHAGWIRRQSRAAREHRGAGFPAEYADGAQLLYRGQPLALRLGDDAGACLGDGCLTVPRQAAKAAVWAWYARQADAVLGAALAASVARLEWLREPPTWRHRYMSSRWGSCSAQGRVALNTHLVKLADDLVEYVAVHELCHLRHLNHGPAFQALLRESVPDWRERRRALRRHGDLLREPPPAAGPRS